MDFPGNDSNGFNRAAADKLYQLLLDLNTYGTTDIYVDPKTLLSTEFDAISAISRSAALEREAQEILKVFTSAPVTPVLRDVNTAFSNANERALVPRTRNNFNIEKRNDCYKIDIWKDNSLVTTIENYRTENLPMHFISIKIDKTGAFMITGLDNVTDDIKEVIQELGGMIAIENTGIVRNEESSGVEIREITDGSEQIIEVPLHDGILKFTSNQNPLDVLSEIYCTEETSDNKKIFKVPILGDFVVSPEDDPVKVFKAITGYDLTDFYKNSDVAIAEIPDNSELAIAEIPDDTENKENEINVKKTRSQRHKKNKQKRKSKKRK